jgi:hypothetical protein
MSDEALTDRHHTISVSLGRLFFDHKYKEGNRVCNGYQVGIKKLRSLKLQFLWIMDLLLKVYLENLRYKKQ